MNDDFFRSFYGAKEDDSVKIKRRIRNLRRPRPAIPSIPIPTDSLKIGTFSLLYLLILFAISYANFSGPEDWWWSCLNAYLPQWAWLVPGVVLFVFAMLKARRVAYLSVIGLIWVLVPLMGFCWRFHRPTLQNFPGGIPIRIMTYNVDQNSHQLGVLEEIERNHPDIILLQEANKRIDRSDIASLRDWNIVFHRDGCLAITRFPVLHSEWRNIPGFWGRGQFLRMELLVHSRKIVVYDIHLDTPRNGLSDLRTNFLTNMPEFVNETRERVLKARTITSYMDNDHEPMIVAGDFNAPPDSLICRTLEGNRLKDVFSEVGRGYGYTYGYTLRPYIPYIRIDHILTGSRIRPLRCWVGSSDASDHRALISDLVVTP